MTPEEFVTALRTVVLGAAVEATVATLERPPGRRPRQEVVETSQWFQSLSDEDRAMMVRVLKMTARHAVFGFLAVLDGARVIEDDPHKGDFRLVFQKGDMEWDLIDPEGAPLHDILNQQINDV